MFSTTQPEIPLGQDWLLKRIEIIGYKPNPLGVCFGVSHMAMQALIAGEFNNFYRRLQLINSIPIDKFAEQIEKITQKRLKLIEDVKKESIESFLQLSITDIEMLEKDPVVITQLNDIKKIIIKKNLTEEEQAQEFEKRKTDWIRNRYIQKKIDEAILELPLDERLIFEIPAFFESAELYQQPNKYFKCEEFLDIKHKNNQDFNVSILLCLSKKLEQLGGVIELDAKISGVYDQISLKDYLDCLLVTVKSTYPLLQNPFVLTLSTLNHVITVCLDPIKNSWQVIDMNIMRSANAKLNNALASKKIFSSLTDNQFCIYSTKVYGAKADELILNNILQKLEQSKKWHELHSISYQKNLARDSDGASWLLIGTESNNNELVKQLVFNGADINVSASPYNFSPLQIAIGNGNMELVKLFLSKNANLNYKNNEELTLLAHAIHLDQVEMIKFLMKETEIDSNLATKTATPLFYAAQEGAHEIVSCLLQYERTDVTIPFKKTVTKLLDYAKSRDVESQMKLFFQKKNIDIHDGNQIVSMTPAEIATIMGHHEIAEMIIQRSGHSHDLPRLSSPKK